MALRARITEFDLDWLADGLLLRLTAADFVSKSVEVNYLYTPVE